MLVVILVLIAVFGPLVAPHAADEFVAMPFSPPGSGADLRHRLPRPGRAEPVPVRAAGAILVLAVVSTAIGLVVGVAIGLVAAYARNCARRRPDARAWT